MNITSAANTVTENTQIIADLGNDDIGTALKAADYADLLDALEAETKAAKDYLKNVHGIIMIQPMG